MLSSVSWVKKEWGCLALSLLYQSLSFPQGSQAPGGMLSSCSRSSLVRKALGEEKPGQASRLPNLLYQLYPALWMMAIKLISEQYLEFLSLSWSYRIHGLTRGRSWTFLGPISKCHPSNATNIVSWSEESLSLSFFVCKGGSSENAYSIGLLRGFNELVGVKYVDQS